MLKDARTALLCVTAALALAGPSPLLAQASSDAKSGQTTQKLIAESDKFRVYDIVQQPGDTGPAASRLGNFVYIINGGSIERTFADGSKVVTHRKAGDSALIDERRPYSVKNVGDTTVHLIMVQPK